MVRRRPGLLWVHPILAPRLRTDVLLGEAVIPDVIVTRIDPPELRLVSRVTFDPPLTIHNGEVLRVTYSMTPAGDIEVKNTQVMPAPTRVLLNERELHQAVVEEVKLFPEGVRIGDLEIHLQNRGYDFGQADLRAAVWSLIAIRKLDLNPSSILTIHIPEE